MNVYDRCSATLTIHMDGANQRKRRFIGEKSVLVAGNAD